jgi:mannose-6-phosphate isomerase-like protein (cupin superfamily)
LCRLRTSLFPVCSPKPTVRDEMAREQAGKRRGFGRIEKRPSGRYRAAYTGADGQLYRAPMTFDAKDDAVAWLSARRAEIEMRV